MTVRFTFSLSPHAHRRPVRSLHHGFREKPGKGIILAGAKPLVRLSHAGRDSPLELRDLVEAELDRSLTSEDRDHDLDLGLVEVDLGDGAVEVDERP